MGVETICLRESADLAKRSIKYWHLVSKLYLEGLKDPHSAKVFRAAYFFCRHIDDVLDGDRKITQDPEDYTRSILHSMEYETKGPEIMELYRFAIGPITEMAKESDDPKANFIKVIRDAMLFDYHRSKSKRVLTEDQLERYYEDTFVPVMDIAFIIAQSNQRSSDIPEIISTQGHIYSIRDLRRDLDQGIVNIPKNVLTEAGFTRAPSFEQVVSNPSLASWRSSEVERYQSELRIAKEKISDSASRKVCLPLIWQMQAYCKLYQWGLQN